MKTPVCILILLALSSTATAQCPSSLIVTESWTTYCDNGVTRVRMTLNVLTPPAELPTLPPDLDSDIGALDSNDPGGLLLSSTFDRIETLVLRHVAGDFFRLPAHEDDTNDDRDKEPRSHDQ